MDVLRGGIDDGDVQNDLRQIWDVVLFPCIGIIQHLERGVSYFFGATRFHEHEVVRHDVVVLEFPGKGFTGFYLYEFLRVLKSTYGIYCDGSASFEKLAAFGIFIVIGFCFGDGQRDGVCLSFCGFG